MQYDHTAIPDAELPTAGEPLLAHMVSTYASETNKTASMWLATPAEHLDFAPHDKTNSIRKIFEHQILSERRFFAQFVGFAEPPADQLLPACESPTVQQYVDRYVELAKLRLPQIAGAPPEWWLEEQPFFGFERQRIWTFWRRVLHTCHHRTQVQSWLRLAGAHVPSIYGPSGDVSWDAADPTYSVAAAGRPAG